MKRLIAFTFILLISSALVAQDAQWADRVIDFSSQLNYPQHSAEQILGKPNALQTTTESEVMSPNAWMPKKSSGLEFIKIGFANPIKIQQIAIVESYNPSALTQILAYDEHDDEKLLMEFQPRQIPLFGRLFRTYFDLTDYEVHALKLVFDGSVMEDNYGVDAVGISDSKIPISIQVNVTNEIVDNFEPEKLNQNINTQYVELKPLISPDNQTLYFSRQRHPDNIGGIKDDEDIWYSKKDLDGNWGPAQNIGPPLNNEGPNFISSITPDGNSVLVLLGNEYRNKKKMKAGLSVSSKTSEGWTFPEPVEIENNYNLSPRANFFLANNRKVLIMSIERNDSEGDRDLYVSFLQDDTTWTKPLNLGPVVNSADEESAPFLAVDDKTLFFSSRGFSGFGGYDIYISKRLDDTWTNWSEPENLGATINSSVDDIFFNLSIEDEFAYFSRGTIENVDIYRVELPFYQKPDIIVKIRGRVLHAENNTPLKATIRYERLSDGKEIGLTNSDSLTGKYQIILPAGYEYGYYADKKGFIPLSANIDLTNISESKEIERDLYLMPIKAQEPIVLNNVFFKFAKAELKESSFPELKRLLKLLWANPNMEIEVSGHTCSIGSEEYNQGLSERRAQAIYDYLVDHQIDANRLSAKGYGELMPKASNETEEGRQINRRVEFKITNEAVISSTN
ncbi:MAG: OmpA family protein [Candidatus Cyclobacteriaceae bacterium M3_2C_046]